MFQGPQSLQFLIRVWRHICIKSAGLDLWWNLPEECFRGRGPGGEKSLPPCERGTCEKVEEEDEGGRGIKDGERKMYCDE